MAFKFPFTNYHELNLTWVLDQLKKLFEESAENVTTIETYENRLTAVETELPGISETASEASRAAAAAGTLAQTAKETADTAQENAMQASGLAGTARQEAQAAQTAANEATQAAQQAQATAQNFDGRITQAENDASQALEASRSFENRVQSAITTANNANQTATNAQGIAMRADQNAGAALDKIGDLSQLTTTAKNNLVAAINEAAQTGGAGAVTSVNGKTGAVILDASDIGYNGTTIETALNGKQNAPTAAGIAGQVLGLDNNLQPVWVDQTGGSGDISNCAPLIINTASGAVASFSDGANNRQIRKIIGTIESADGVSNAIISLSGALKYIFNIKQSGEGIPSPTNNRPIIGYNILLDDGTPITVYGGNIAINNDGSISVIASKKGVIYDGSEDENWDSTTSTYYVPSPSDCKKTQIPVGNWLHGVQNISYLSMPDLSFAVTTSPYNYVNFKYTSIGSLASFKTLLSENPLTVVYELVKPVTYSISSIRQIQSIIIENNYGIETLEIDWSSEAGTISNGTVTINEDGSADIVNNNTGNTYHLTNVGILFTKYGVNNVWIDTGSITEIQYPADTKLYIDNKIAELQALILEH